MANEVETEQIVDDPGGRGFGSVWSHAVSASCGPRVDSAVLDPGALRARRAHEITLQRFEDPRTPPPRATFNAWTSVSVLRRSCLVWFEVVNDAPGRARCEANLAAALHRVNSRLPEARERVACVHWDFAKHMTRGGGGGGGGGGVKRGDGVSGGARNPWNPPP